MRERGTRGKKNEGKKELKHTPETVYVGNQKHSLGEQTPSSAGAGLSLQCLSAPVLSNQSTHECWVAFSCQSWSLGGSHYQSSSSENLGYQFWRSVLHKAGKSLFREPPKH